MVESTRHETLEELARRPPPRSCPPNRVYETMTTVVLEDVTVRVWREEPSLDRVLAKSAGDPQVRSMIHWNSFCPASILLNVGLMPRVAAIEILDTKTRCGTLFYPDWK